MIVTSRYTVYVSDVSQDHLQFAGTSDPHHIQLVNSLPSDSQVRQAIIPICFPANYSGPLLVFISLNNKVSKV